MRLNPGRIGAWTALIVFLILTILPFYWMIRTAVTPAADLYTDSTGVLPAHPTMINFWRVLGLVDADAPRKAGGSGAQIDFLRYTMNSGIYALSIAAVQTFCCAMAGYAFARLRFPGRDLVFGILIAALMV